MYFRDKDWPIQNLSVLYTVPKSFIWNFYCFGTVDRLIKKKKLAKSSIQQLIKTQMVLSPK